MQSNPKIDPALLQRILEDDDSAFCAELEQVLEAELLKPPDEIDYHLVADISDTLCKIYDIDEIRLAQGQGKCIAKLFPHHTRKKRILNKLIKPLTVCAIAVCSLMVLTNLPLHTTSVDLIPEIVATLDGAVTLSLDGSRNAHLQPVKGQPDPLGITELFASLEIPTFAPTYAPEGVTETNRAIHQCGHRREATIWYDCGDGTMVFSAWMDTDPNNPEDAWGFPTETYQLKSGEHGGIYMITLEEEERYHAVFAVGGTCYHFSAADVDFAVCRAIMESFATEPAATTELTQNEPDV